MAILTMQHFTFLAICSGDGNVVTVAYNLPCGSNHQVEQFKDVFMCLNLSTGPWLMKFAATQSAFSIFNTLGGRGVDRSHRGQRYQTTAFPDSNTKAEQAHRQHQAHRCIPHPSVFSHEALSYVNIVWKKSHWIQWHSFLTTCAQTSTQLRRCCRRPIPHWGKQQVLYQSSSFFNQRE